MSIKGLGNWQILQQQNGYASVTIKYEPSGWLKNPKSAEEKRVADLFQGIKARVFEESTGKAVTGWFFSDRINCGSYTVEVKKIPTGGLYILKIETVFINKDGSSFSYGGGDVRHFGVGDLFLIAGQSNAAGWAMGEYEDSPQLGISAYMNGKWELAAQPLGGGGMSPFLSFGKYLYKKLGYPIGLIPRAVGGSEVVSWIKGGEYTEKIRNENLGNIKAVMWYQGCGDINSKEQTDSYEKNFMSFRNEINEIFGDIPVVTFQLNRLRDLQYDKEDGFNQIREIQRQIALKTPSCYLVPTIDLTHMSDHIHNGCNDNIHLGIRAGKLVLDKIYKLEKNYEAPILSEVIKINEKELLISFENVAETLIFFSTREEKYPIKISDNEIEEMKIEKNTIKIKLKENACENTDISINSGMNPGSILIDSISKLPVVCVYDMKM